MSYDPGLNLIFRHEGSGNSSDMTGLVFSSPGSISEKLWKTKASYKNILISDIIWF